MNESWLKAASLEPLWVSSWWCRWECCHKIYKLHMSWCLQVGQRRSLGRSSTGSLIGRVRHRLRLHVRVLEQGSAGAFPPGDRQRLAPDVWEVLRPRLGIPVSAQPPAHQLRGPAHWQSGLHDTRLVMALGMSMEIQTTAELNRQVLMGFFSIWRYGLNRFSLKGQCTIFQHFQIYGKKIWVCETPVVLSHLGQYMTWHAVPAVDVYIFCLQRPACLCTHVVCMNLCHLTPPMGPLHVVRRRTCYRSLIESC